MNGQGQKKEKKTVKKENVHAGHRQRKREQFLRHGADSFADHELLELLLFYAKPRTDTNITAHKLLERFETLESVLAAPPEEIAKVDGMGEVSALLISLIAPIYHRAMISSLKNEQIMDTTERLGRYFVTLFAAETHEIMYQLCLDAKGRRLNLFKISEGGPTGVALNMREIIANALTSNAAMVVLAHNHPSGVALPSAGDRSGTEEVQNALRSIHVTLADHIIVADSDYISFRDSNLL